MHSLLLLLFQFLLLLPLLLLLHLQPGISGRAASVAVVVLERQQCYVPVFGQVVPAVVVQVVVGVDR